MKKTILRATCILAGFIAPVISANAETLTARIPFDFVAGAKTLPAGEYTFSVDAGVLAIRGAAPAHASMLLAVQADFPAPATPPSADFEKSANAVVLSRLNLASGAGYVVLAASSHPARSAKSLALPEGSVLLTRH